MSGFNYPIYFKVLNKGLVGRDIFFGVGCYWVVGGCLSVVGSVGIDGYLVMVD